MYINVCASRGTHTYEIRSRLCIFKLPGVGLSHATWDSLWVAAGGRWVQELFPAACPGGCSPGSAEGRPRAKTQQGLPLAIVGVCCSLSESPQQCLLFLELRGNFSCDVMTVTWTERIYFLIESRSSQKFSKDFYKYRKFTCLTAHDSR